MSSAIQANQPPVTWKQRVMICISSLMIIAVTLMVDLWFDNSFLVVPTGACLLVINLMRLAFYYQIKAAADFIIQWRWLFALMIFGLLVIFEIHTSNAPAYQQVYGSSQSIEDSILFGVPRVSRSDEYNVQLPYYFSQFYNGYQEISHQMSVGGQDMVLGYNSPVLGISMLGKPQTWGYLIFGSARGIAWYFSFKNVMTFMAAFELVNVLTRSKYMAAFGGFFILYSPGMQWWFSPHFFDVMMWSMILFDCGYYFVVWRSWKKWLMTGLSVLALTGFALAIFPSLQVPCGLLMLALLIACILRDRDEIVFKWIDLLNVLAVLAGVAIVLGLSIWEMREGLELVLNTVYPGDRVSVGGYGRLYQLFTNVAAPVQPFRDPDLLNNSEFAQFNHYGVACMIGYPILWFYLRKEKNRQSWIGNVFFIALIIETLFLFFPVSEEFARMTLLSLCNRMQTVLGLTAALFTLWFVEAFWKVRTGVPKWVFGLLISVPFCALSLLDYKSIMMPSFIGAVGKDYFIYMTVILSVMFFLCFTRWRPLFFAFMTAWTFMSGVLVNPIVQGTAAITDYPIVEEARKLVDEDPDAWWLCLNSLTTQNLLLANGAKVLDATNFYPDYEKWKLIDPDLRNQDFYNRYANISVHLQGTNAPTRFENPRPDYLRVLLNPYDLIRLNVRYLVGTREDRNTLKGCHIDYRTLYIDPVTREFIYEINGLDGIELPAYNEPVPVPDRTDKKDLQTPQDSSSLSASIAP